MSQVVKYKVKLYSVSDNYSLLSHSFCHYNIIFHDKVTTAAIIKHGMDILQKAT